MKTALFPRLLLTIAATASAAAIAQTASVAMPTMNSASEARLLADNHGGMSEEMGSEEMMSPEEMDSEEMMSPEEMDSEEMMSPEMTSEQGTTTIAEIAMANDSFDTLAQALQAAGLAETLGSEGPYTVFAPTDEAFAELPEGALEYLLQPENRGVLQQVLKYHVVPGEVMASDLSDGGLDTLSGGLAVRVTDERVIINNGSVVQPNIGASNGVIHVVSRVMLPIAVREQLMAALMAQQ
ncbi:MAG: fasciclin domain-containing protein [Leptolyngbya sp. SIO4C1]|nr:fasciclin domain-containing protein [Leptolyngbya sp. SIO4C1]